MKLSTQLNNEVEDLLENTGTAATFEGTKITFDYTNEDQLYLIKEILELFKGRI